jgi:hypothetical protein
VDAQQLAGFQARVNELTAEKHAFRRELDDLRNTNQQMMLALAQRNQEPQVQLPQVEIDPERKKEMDAYLQPLLQQQAAQHARQIAQLTQAQLPGLLQGQDPRVSARAQEIWNHAQASGDHLRGFTPQQALVYAKGELADALIAAARVPAVNPAVAQTQQYNAQGQVLPGQTTTPPAGQRQAAKPPPDMDEDPEGAAAYYAAKLGDTPF